MADLRKKLGIGTVQFGVDYGISNKVGKTAPREVSDILKVASKNHITMIDTARLYGDSETVLGQTIPAGENFRIVSKTIPVRKNRIEMEDRITVRNGIKKSLEELKSQHLYGLILHHADDLCMDGGQELYEDLLAFKRQGQILKIGISAYDTEQIDAVTSRFAIDLIQIPLNIFDQRLVKNGTLEKLSGKGIEIHVRSAFLQGIVFMDPDVLPAHLEDLKAPLRTFISICREYEISRASAAMAYVLNLPAVGHMICGVNTAAQLEELCHEAANLPVLPKDCFDNIAIDRADLINPALWSKAS